MNASSLSRLNLTHISSWCIVAIFSPFGFSLVTETTRQHVYFVDIGGHLVDLLHHGRCDLQRWCRQQTYEASIDGPENLSITVGPPHSCSCKSRPALRIFRPKSARPVFGWLQDQLLSVRHENPDPNGHVPSNFLRVNSAALFGDSCCQNLIQSPQNQHCPYLQRSQR